VRLEHIPDLLPISIMCVFKTGNIGDGMPRSKFIYIQRGILRLVVMGEWAVKHSWTATP
jgi:hypothetical protein